MKHNDFVPPVSLETPRPIAAYPSLLIKSLTFPPIRNKISDIPHL